MRSSAHAQWRLSSPYMQEIDQGCTQVLVLYRGNIRMPAVVEHLLLFPRLLLDVYRYDGGGRVGRHGCVRLSSFDRSAADFCAKACADPGPAHSPTTASAGARIRVDLPDPAKQPRRIGRPIFLQCLALPLSERILHPAMITDVGPLIPPRRHPRDMGRGAARARQPTWSADRGRRDAARPLAAHSSRPA